MSLWHKHEDQIAGTLLKARHGNCIRNLSTGESEVEENGAPWRSLAGQPSRIIESREDTRYNLWPPYTTAGTHKLNLDEMKLRKAKIKDDVNRKGDRRLGCESPWGEDNASQFFPGKNGNHRQIRPLVILHWLQKAHGVCSSLRWLGMCKCGLVDSLGQVGMWRSITSLAV